MVTFAKLMTGAWGIKSDAKLTRGDVVTVCRRDGSSKQMVVGAEVGDGTHYSAHEVGSEPAAPVARPCDATAKAASRPVARFWRPCGYPGCDRNHCDECEGRGGRGHTYG
jgi:hypothetical protein